MANLAPSIADAPLILVVDDNRDAADSLGRLLSYMGYIARVAYSGPTALHEIDAHRPRIVLLDLGMPGMDGYEVARRIRERPDLTELFLVALSGWGQDQDRQRTRASGFDAHLVKPVDVDHLSRLLRSRESPHLAANISDTADRHSH